MEIKKNVDGKKLRKAIKEAKKLNYIELTPLRKLHLTQALSYTGCNVDLALAAQSGRKLRTIVRQITGESVKIDEMLSIFGKDVFEGVSNLNRHMDSGKRKEAIRRRLAKYGVDELSVTQLEIYDLLTFNDE